MKKQLEELKIQIELFEIKQLEQVENFRLKFLSKKGTLNQFFEEFKTVPSEMKREVGSLLNQVKQKAQQKWEEAQSQFESNKNHGKNEHIDLTLPSDKEFIGSRHPLKIIENEIIEIFKTLGFVYAEGPEIEDDWHNFSALNFPPNHPARDMQDTFFISEDIALRTHTSSVQVRLMENQKPPIRAIMPGRVYRQTLYHFIQALFGQDVSLRIRPSYFPFTEPSAEMDISCMLCKGSGCNVCKHTGWLEILGCGMIDPNVLQASGIDPEKYSGFAFGMGIERIAMLKFEVKDLRTYFTNDVRFLNQFESLGS